MRAQDRRSWAVEAQVERERFTNAFFVAAILAIVVVAGWLR